MILHCESSDKPNYLKTVNNDKWHAHKPKKSSKKLQMPQIKYGNSYEAPNNFFQRESHLNTRTYQNPYLDSTAGKEQLRSSKKPTLQGGLSNIQQYSVSNGQEGTLGKSSLQQLQQEMKDKMEKQNTVRIYNPVTDQLADHTLNKSLNKPTDLVKQLHNQTNKSNGFHIKLGLFTDYVENNNCLNVYGPLCNNKRGIRRDPYAYAYSNVNGVSIPRNQKVQMDLNPDVMDTFRRTAESTYNRKSMGSFMMIHKKEQKQKSLDRNKLMTQISSIKEGIMSQNSVINDGQHYVLQKDNEIAKQEILHKLGMKYPQRYLDEDKYRSHTLYKENTDYIESFERQNSLLFNKPISQTKVSKVKGLQYYRDKLQSQQKSAHSIAM